MSKLIPNRFLFDFEFPLHYQAKTPPVTGKLDNWPARYLVPNLAELDETQPFGNIWASWNDDGISIACEVKGKSKKLRCDPKTFWKGDNLRLCTDMRDTRNIKRASKYCQQFFFLPCGGGKDNKKPVAGTSPIQRARENAPTPPASRIEIASVISKDGYTLEAHIAASALSGFAPAEHPRIGFFYMLEDLQLGQQYLTVGDDLYWNIDPSTWATAVLVR